MKKLFIALFLLIATCGCIRADEPNIAVTIYNNNLALVREVRSIDFQKGLFDFRFKDVPSRIDPTSVHFKPLKWEDRIAILEQNYQYDLVSSDKIFEKYIDYKIAVRGKNGQEYRGTLLSYTGNHLVIQGDEGDLNVIRNEEVTDFSFEKLPEGLLTRPTLVWKFDSGARGKADCEVSYLTGGMDWHAEYVAVVADDEKSLELSGWVSVENKSGGSFKNAKMKLIAGDVNIIQPEPGYGRGAPMMMERTTPEKKQFEERAFFEYHLYSLKRPADLMNNEIKQISFIPSTRVKAKKIYTYEQPGYSYYRRDESSDNVKVELEFKNSQAEGLGIPLPRGKVRGYKMDIDGSMEFIGEDMIDHTPKDEMVRIYVGDAFDLVGERKKTEHKTIAKYINEESYEITLRNHKKERVEIVVVERLSYRAGWEILKSSHKYTKKDAHTIEFTVPVEKDGETVITYTVRYDRR
jgi:hypothetical protein